MACGNDYSAALSLFGEVFTTGNSEYGKLGLGEAIISGNIMNFTKIVDI